MPTEEEMRAEIERLRAENESLKKPARQLVFGSERQGRAVGYEMGRFPLPDPRTVGEAASHVAPYPGSHRGKRPVAEQEEQLAPAQMLHRAHLQGQEPRRRRSAARCQGRQHRTRRRRAEPLSGFECRDPHRRTGASRRGGTVCCTTCCSAPRRWLPDVAASAIRERRGTRGRRAAHRPRNACSLVASYCGRQTAMIAGPASTGLADGLLLLPDPRHRRRAATSPAIVEVFDGATPVCCCLWAIFGKRFFFL